MDGYLLLLDVLLLLLLYAVVADHHSNIQHVQDDGVVYDEDGVVIHNILRDHDNHMVDNYFEVVEDHDYEVVVVEVLDSTNIHWQRQQMLLHHI